MTVVTPVFDRAGENIIYTVASRGHHADIGRKTIKEEGVLIDNFLLVEADTLRDQATRNLLTLGEISVPQHRPEHG